MPRYVALLRGINVGGNNLIKMAALRACFEANGYDDVVTYIQSGNVVFSTKATSIVRLTTDIERILASAFDYEAAVVVRSHSQMRRNVEEAPRGFGTDSTKYRSDVVFLMPPITAKTAIREVETRPGVDEAWTGTGVLYFERLVSKASQSRLPRLASKPIYKVVTIRNWNTTTKLLALLDAAALPP